MSDITKLIQTGGKIENILEKGAYMLACTLGSALITVVVGFLFSKVGSRFSARLRENVYDKVQNFSENEIKKFSKASLITRTTNDVNQIQMFVTMGLNIIIKAPILAIWAICVILGKSWQWSVATAIVVLLLMTLVAILVVFVLPRFRKIQTLTDDMNRVTRENLTGVRVVRAFNAEEYSEEKFDNINKELTKNQIFANRILGIMSPFMAFMMSGLSLAIYWIGAVLIQNAIGLDKLLLFSDMVVFGSYAMQVVMAFIMLIIIFIMLPRASVSAKRINEVLDTQSSINDGQLIASNSELQGEVEFNNVSFKYPDANEYILKDISFKVSKGQTIAFIGSTGSGKSTLINLIPRFYDTTEGNVFVDGIDVKDYNLKDLYNKIGYISQKAMIFSGTIKSNIAYGISKDEISENGIIEALEISQAKEFVETKEKGIDSEVTQGGNNLSGGQKQRLSIARAIAKKPEILIFDDSFSALDYSTDKMLRNALKNNINDTTVFIVAQRIGTIRDSDKIVVLDNGKMVGIGSHEELMANCKIYKELALSQLSKEELK